MSEDPPPARKSRNRRNGHKRGKGNKERRAEETSKEWGELLKDRRFLEVMKRSVATVNISPYLWEQPGYANSSQVNQDTKDWYRSMPYPSNQYLTVSAGVNHANPTGTNGHKGVFAKCDIPVSTYICPYLGQVLRKAPADCEYTVQLDKMTFVDAREILYDSAYIMLRKKFRESSRHFKCPPNYGRYINTLNAKVGWQYNVLMERRNHYFNATLEADRDGTDTVWVYANRNIRKGEEILMDYGLGFRYYSNVDSFPVSV